MSEQSQRLNKVLNNLQNGKTRIETVKSLIETLVFAEKVIYDLTIENNNQYKDLSANYVSHVLSGSDSLCERYKCRDALNDYKCVVELYMDCVMDIKWLMDELYVLKIVELCRTGR